MQFPAALLGLVLLLAAHMAPAQTKAQSEADRKTKLKDLPTRVEEAVKGSFATFAPTGLAVAVVKDGQVIYRGGHGTKDAATGAPIGTGSLFNIASCTKAFTAAALAMLVNEGKLKWDDKVVDHIAGFRLADPWITAQLTVRDLLCHRSGLSTFYGDLLWYGTNYTDAEILGRLRHVRMLNEFRTQFGYQNNLYMVGGLVVEKVSGKTWEAFVRERILVPLGMTGTRTSNDAFAGGEDIAKGHIRGKVQEVYDFNGTKAAASMYSSVDDLARWVRALLGGGSLEGTQVLTPDALRTMWTAHTVIPVSPNSESWGIHFRAYGLGWSLHDYSGKKVIEHDGGMPGYISKVTLVPELGLGIVLLNNGMDFQINDALRYKLIDDALGQAGRDWDATFMNFRKLGEQWEHAQAEARANARVMGTKPSLGLSAYTGTFDDPSYGKARVEERGGGLHLTFLPAAGIFSGQMEHWHFDTFKVVFKDDFLTYGLVSFDVGPAGKVRGFKIDLPSDDFQFFELDFRRAE